MGIKRISEHYNPIMLKWARERSAYSLESIATLKVLKITQSELQAIEEGQFQATFSQLKHLAKKYKVPLAYFYASQPPKPTQKPIDRRSKTSQTLGVKTTISLNKAIYIQKSYQQLVSQSQPIQFWYAENLTIKAQANQARNWLSITPNLQIEQTKDSGQFLQKLITALENKGILVLIHSFPSEEAQAYCLHGRPPVIVLSSTNTNKEKRIFSLLHELYHLARNTSGMCLTEYQTAQNIEKICDEFAAQFLAPLNLLENQDVSNFKVIKKLALKLKISQYALLVRLKNLKYISQADYNARVRELKKSPPFPGRGGQSPTKLDTVVKENSNIFITEVFSRYRRGIINSIDVSDFLGIQESYVGDIESKIFSL